AGCTRLKKAFQVLGKSQRSSASCLASEARTQRPGRRAPVQSGAREHSDGLHPEFYGDTDDMDRAGRAAACGIVRGLSVCVKRRRHAGPRGGEQQRPRKWREGRG
ncbi:unnamed protein product, partial [Ectocarpus sp. 6 AP-2014]